MSPKPLVRAGALAVAGGAVALTAAPATAHVTIAPSEGAAGSSTLLTASVGHGCDSSPTTRLTFQVPERVLSVTPTRNPLWDVRTVMQQLDEPVTDSHGNEVTERVARVVYTAKEPLPEGYRDTFDLSLQLPDTPGETLAFPVIQTCERGETAWVETAADGETEDLEAPAPTVTITDGDGHGAAADGPSDDATQAAIGSESDGGGSDALSIAALVAGLLGLAVGALALVTARKRA